MSGSHTQSGAIAALDFVTVQHGSQGESNHHGAMRTASWSERSASPQAQERVTNSSSNR